MPYLWQRVKLWTWFPGCNLNHSAHEFISINLKIQAMSLNAVPSVVKQVLLDYCYNALFSDWRIDFYIQLRLNIQRILRNILFLILEATQSRNSEHGHHYFSVDVILLTWRYSLHTCESSPLTTFLLSEHFLYSDYLFAFNEIKHA